MQSWKTTVSGVIAIVVAVLGAAQNLITGHPVDYTAVIAAVMAGIGLIMAKDFNASGAGSTAATTTASTPVATTTTK